MFSQSSTPFGEFSQPQENTAPTFGGPISVDGLLSGASTTTTQPTGVGGQQQQQPTFGSTGGTFGAPQAGQQQSGGGLFGNPTAGAFGIGGGGFGAPASNPFGAGLFSSSTGDGGCGLGITSTFGTSAPAVGLFGSTTSQPTTFLFGGEQQQPNSTFGGGFGSSTTTRGFGSTGGGLFGAPARAAPFFNAPVAPSEFGGGLFGSTAPAPTAFGSPALSNPRHSSSPFSFQPVRDKKVSPKKSKIPSLATAAPLPVDEKLGNLQPAFASRSSLLTPDPKSWTSQKQNTASFNDLSTIGSSLFPSKTVLSTEEETNEIQIDETQKTDNMSGTPDYHIILERFYEKHNPSKLSEVRSHLEKYKGREIELFAKLAQKYQVPNPLTSQTSLQETITLEPAPASKAPFGQMGSSFGTAEGQRPQMFWMPQPSSGSFSNQSTFGNNAPSSNPFGQSTTVSSSPFGTSNPTNIAVSQPFGQVTSLMTPRSFDSSAIGQEPSVLAATSSSVVTFGGRTPRELLLAFYQQHNPSKMAEVDKLIGKYQGNEEQMLRNLAKKYNLDPSVFGLSAATANGVGSVPGMTGAISASSGAFGQPSALGGGPTFGSVAKSPNISSQSTPTLGGGAAGGSGGTRAVPYIVTNMQDGSTSILLQDITAMSQYINKSPEELRFEDYSQASRLTDAPTGDGLGALAQKSEGLFGSPAPAFVYGRFDTPVPFGGVPYVSKRRLLKQKVPMRAREALTAKESACNVKASGDDDKASSKTPAGAGFGAPQAQQQALRIGLFGNATAGGFGGGGFGAPTPSPFGAAPAGGCIFGSSTGEVACGFGTNSTFVAHAPACGLFGSPTSQPTTSLFGSGQQQQSNTTFDGDFDSSTATGCFSAPYTVTNVQDQSGNIILQDITAMPQYENKSPEELRFEDYSQVNRRTAAPTGGGLSAPVQQSGRLFDAPASGYGRFGTPAPFGSTSTFVVPSGEGLFGRRIRAPRVTNRRRLKKITRVRVALEDATAAEFASNIEAAGADDKESSTSTTSSPNPFKSLESNRAVDYERQVSHLVRRIQDLGYNENLNDRKANAFIDLDYGATSQQVMGILTYTEPQRNSLLRNALQAQQTLLKNFIY